MSDSIASQVILNMFIAIVPQYNSITSWIGPCVKHFLGGIQFSEFENFEKMSTEFREIEVQLTFR